MISYTFLSKPTTEQIKQVIDLYREAGWWSDGNDSVQSAERIITGSYLFLTAEYRKRIIGMGRSISDGVSDAYLQDITVTAAYRSRGVGGEIVKMLVTRLVQDGIRWIGLIAENNSQPFYSPFGFKKMPNATPMLCRK